MKTQDQRRVAKAKKKRKQQRRDSLLMLQYPDGGVCRACGKRKPVTAFYNPNKVDGTQKCKTCSRKARKLSGITSSAPWYLKLSAEDRRRFAEKRYKQIKQATPEWYDAKAVAELRRKARDSRLVVDHIVPLQSEYVCGLHVQDNMQLLTRQQNQRKSNLVWEDMW